MNSTVNGELFRRLDKLPSCPTIGVTAWLILRIDQETLTADNRKRWSAVIGFDTKLGGAPKELVVGPEITATQPVRTYSLRQQCGEPSDEGHHDSTERGLETRFLS